MNHGVCASGHLDAGRLIYSDGVKVWRCDDCGAVLFSRPRFWRVTGNVTQKLDIGFNSPEYQAAKAEGS